MIIKSNHHNHKFLYFYELPKSVQNDFDYADKDGDFIKYKNRYYSIEDFMRADGIAELKDWNGYSSDTYFSGVVIKLINSDTYKIGTYIS